MKRLGRSCKTCVGSALPSMHLICRVRKDIPDHPLAEYFVALEPHCAILPHGKLMDWSSFNDRSGWSAKTFSKRNPGTEAETISART